MPNYLGSMTRCESHVNTRLRYVQKLVGTGGSQIKRTITLTHVIQKVYVVDANTKQNAPNGEFTMNTTVSGEDLSKPSVV